VALRNAGLNIEVHDDHFESGVEDVVWLEKCSHNDWVVLAKDKAMKHNALARKLIFSGGIAAFFLTSGNHTAEENAKAIIQGLTKMANLLDNQRRPFIARINNNGDVQLWLDHKGKDRLKKK
jgi:PIN like domain